MQVDERQLLVLLSQLRLNSLQAKPQLQRVVYNLSQHHDTLRAVLRLSLTLLRFPLSPDEAEAAMEEDQTSPPRSLQDALQVCNPLPPVMAVTTTRPCSFAISVVQSLPARHSTALPASGISAQLPGYERHTLLHA